jgi:predicted transcriptional regulator
MAGKPKVPAHEIIQTWLSLRQSGAKVGKKRIADAFCVSERTIRRALKFGEVHGLVPEGTIQPTPERLKRRDLK